MRAVLMKQQLAVIWQRAELQHDMLCKVLMVLALSVLVTSSASASSSSCDVQDATVHSCLSENIHAAGYQGSCPPAGGPCNRCLGYFVGQSFNDHVTREGCACICHQRGYTRAGVENGNNCYCGSQLSASYCGAEAQGACAKGCTGNATQEACGGPNAIEMLTFSCPEACTVPGPAPAPPAPVPPTPVPAPVVRNRFTPRVHYTPPCYLSAPPHDIAAAIWDDRAGLWHVFAGCWREGGWQHLVSRDLLAWTPLGTPAAFAGTGGLVFDTTDGHVGDNTRSLVAYAATLETWLGSGANYTSWAPQGQQFKGTGNDPVLWYDERDGRWYAATAAKVGFGLEDYWSSPALTGPAVNWTHLPAPLFVARNLSLPGCEPMPQTQEFVSPDFFPLDAADPHSPWVFLTSTYGRPYDGAQTYYNFANYWVGERPAPGASFMPRRGNAAAGVIDWSCFYPANATTALPRGGARLELATDYGLTQFGCCPKTATQPAQQQAPGVKGRSRRVMFGWLQNGGSNDEGGRGDVSSTNNTMTLPRELSLAPDGVTLLQAFVPELQALRRTHFRAVNIAVPVGGAAGAHFFGPAAGAQLEISATFKLSAALRDSFGTNAEVGNFGLLVLAASDTSEHTVIGFDLSHQTVFLDRKASGAPDLDGDVRAGPWPSSAGLGDETSITVHVYVDHSVVSLIAANETAITAWVHPQSKMSTGVAVWSAVEGVKLDSIDVWALSDSN